MILLRRRAAPVAAFFEKGRVPERNTRYGVIGRLGVGNIIGPEIVMAKQEFNCRWKHQFTDAPDVYFACIADDETHIVEVEPTPGQLDSCLLIQLAVRTFPDHGIDAVARQNDGYGNTRPPWKIIMKLGGANHRVEVVEVMTVGRHKEFTVILKPTGANRVGRLATYSETSK